MVISNLTCTKNNTTVTLAADLAFRGKKIERAYISVDKKYESFVTHDASPFLAVALLPCMKTKENIYIDAPVSSKLLSNTNLIMSLVSKWNIGLTEINIRTKSTTKDNAKPKYTGTFFTAGVDSFYTYLKHAKGSKKITHFILVHGFDIPLSNKSFFNKVKSTVEKVATEEKINAIFLETNIGEIVEKRLLWEFSHGGALAAVALFLRNNIKTVLISGAVKNDQLFPYGTHPELDKLWSTEKMSIKSVGGEYDRLGKINAVVSKSPLALKYLRVCAQNLKGKYNCSRCFKCLMTMMYLEGNGVLSQAKTFDKTIDLAAVKKMYYDYKLKYNIQGEMILALLKQKKRNVPLQVAIAYSLEKSKRPQFMKLLYKAVAAFDQNYNDRRLYQFVFKMNNKDDRNFIFKFLFKKGILK